MKALFPVTQYIRERQQICAVMVVVLSWFISRLIQHCSNMRLLKCLNLHKSVVFFKYVALTPLNKSIRIHHLSFLGMSIITWVRL